MPSAAYLDSPLGRLLAVADENGALTNLSLPTVGIPWPEDATEDPAVFEHLRTELDAYFAGSWTSFSIPLALNGTPFQVCVWEQLLGIPFGATISYGELAERVGDRGAAQAVGAANGQNPIAIVVPCHRVIGANGSLTGYAGGLDAKRTLLRLEAQPVGLFA